MGLFDKILGNEAIRKNISQMLEKNGLPADLDLSQLAGNKNVLQAIKNIATNPELTAKLAQAKDDKQVKELIDSAVAAMKDLKLSEEEKKDLAQKAKLLVANRKK